MLFVFRWNRLGIGYFLTEQNLKRFYNGSIDDFALFNRGLTQDEIKGLMNSIQNILPVNETKFKLTSIWGNIKISDP